MIIKTLIRITIIIKQNSYNNDKRNDNSKNKKE